MTKLTNRPRNHHRIVLDCKCIDAESFGHQTIQLYYEKAEENNNKNNKQLRTVRDDVFLVRNEYNLSAGERV